MSAIFTLGFVVAGPASAQPAAPPAASLARSAFLATMDGEFRKADANKDDVVTRAELEAQQRQTAADAAARHARALFARVDADHNGQISQDEFVRAMARQAKPADVGQMMARLDSNRDQKVTLVEYRTLTLATFDRLDSDKDGIVSAAEQRAGGLAKK